jgi:hypothetical protein
MKVNKFKERLQPDRPMTMVSLRIPEDVVEDLKQIAPRFGFSGYQLLIRAYIGRGLRADIERLEGSVEIATLLESLRKQGVEDGIIAAAVADAQDLQTAEQRMDVKKNS